MGFLKKLSLTIIIVLLSFISSFALVINTETISNDIVKSINEHPERWIDTGSRFVFCDDSAIMKQLKKKSWPEHDSDLVLYYNFYTTFNYVELKKPFEYDFKKDEIKDLIKVIKLYKLNRLINEIGHLIEKEPDPVIQKQIKPKEKIVKKGNKL